MRKQTIHVIFFHLSLILVTVKIKQHVLFLKSANRDACLLLEGSVLPQRWLFRIEIFQEHKFQRTSNICLKENQSIHFHRSSKVRKQTFSDRNKSKKVSRNKITFTYNAWHFGCRILFFPAHNFYWKSKLDARKENQCTVLWLLNGFLSFNLLLKSRNSFQAQMLN